MSVDLQTLKRQHDLPNIAHTYGVELRQCGRGFIGRCPFHDDHNPSFSIFMTSTGDWHFKCFSGSCGLSGDVLDFVGLMRFGQGWNPNDSDMFKEVLELLGEKDMGASEKKWVVEYSPESLKVHEVTSTVRFVWDVALNVYAERLLKTPEAVAYLTQTRKLPLEILRKYRFGYCPPEGTALKYALYALGKRDKDLKYASIFRPSKRSGQKDYEFFYGRITFADVDWHSRPTYVFGRSLPGASSHNKYLGLALFAKPVFGLAALASTGPVLLMEGPINAMIASYWGFNAIALTGTNPSPAHLEEIESRIVKRNRQLIPVLDNDEAGSVAIVKWREYIPKMEDPIRLPAEVDGKLIKDINDLHTATKKGRQLFVNLLKKRRLA